MIISSCTPLRLFFPFYLFIYPDYYFLSHYVKKMFYVLMVPIGRLCNSYVLWFPICFQHYNRGFLRVYLRTNL